MAEEALKVETNPAGIPLPGPVREKSSIQFPYLSLEDAIMIAKGIHTVGGSSCQLDQLGAHLDLKPDTGSFKLKLGTAKMFGLIKHSLGTATLTPLGARICDPQQEAAAKAESFLTIPLYLKVYEEFKGAALPPLAGLETAIANMGVPQKQKATARQMLQKSANLAGFFWSGPNRLVYPPLKGAAPGAVGSGSFEKPENEGEKEKEIREKAKPNGGDDGSGGDQHPFIQGLIKTLPKTEGPWPPEKRAQWLQAAVSVFNLIYTDDGAGARIEVKVIKEPTQ